MEQGFIDGIQKMVNDYGRGCLLEARKAKAMLGDFTQNNYPKETNLLKQLLDADCAKIIKEANNVAEVKTALVKRLENEHSISPKGSAEMLDLLGLVLRGDTSKTGAIAQPATASPTQPKPAPTGELRPVRRAEYIKSFSDAFFEFFDLSGIKSKRGDLALESTTNVINGIAVVQELADLDSNMEGRVVIDMTKETALYISEVLYNEKFTVTDNKVKLMITDVLRGTTSQVFNKILSRDHGYNFKATEPVFFTGNNITGMIDLSKIDCMVVPFIFENNKKMDLKVTMYER